MGAAAVTPRGRETMRGSSATFILTIEVAAIVLAKWVRREEGRVIVVQPWGGGA